MRRKDAVPKAGRGETDESPTYVLPATPLRRPWTIGFAIVAGLVLVLLIFIFRPIVRPLLWAAALAVLVYPAHRRLLDALGGRATLAASVSTLLWVAISWRRASGRNQWCAGRGPGPLLCPIRHLHLLAPADGERSPLGVTALHVASPVEEVADRARLPWVQNWAPGIARRARHTLNAPGRCSSRTRSYLLFFCGRTRVVKRLREALRSRRRMPALIDTVAKKNRRGVPRRPLPPHQDSWRRSATREGAPAPILLGFRTSSRRSCRS